MKKLLLSTSILFCAYYSAQSWNTTGNTGTNPSTNFIGTTDNQSLVFKTNNEEKMRLSPNGRLVFFNNSSQTYSKNLYIGGGNDTAFGDGGTTNWANVAVGLGSMVANTTGAANTALGFNSLASSTTGSSNTALGVNAMQFSTASSNNVAVGINSLRDMIEGSENTAVGNQAMRVTGSNINTPLIGNTAVGFQIFLYLNSGSYNSVVGRRSFASMRKGSNNISLGSNNASDVMEANNNIYIGNNIVPTASIPSNELNIGNWIFGNSGKISIGGRANFTCSDCAEYSLFVRNGIKAEKVKVDIASANGWADYVFAKNYNLKSLEEVEKHITEKGHLPNVPSAKEVAENGINVAEMDAKLLEKIEELTLYSIEQNNKNKEQEQQLKVQTEKIEKLEKMLLELTNKK